VLEKSWKKLSAALFAAGLLAAGPSGRRHRRSAEGMGPMRGFERLHRELI